MEKMQQKKSKEIKQIDSSYYTTNQCVAGNLLAHILV